MAVIKSLLVFVLAGVCEIGGGYLIWLCLKENKPLWYAFIGGLLLALYGIIATLQTSDFAKVYAAYGEFFVVLSFLWAFKFEKYSLTKYDVVGALIVLLGSCIIYYSPKA